ncbi:N2227-domain-containing protein [Gloeophyllum trabeum ATCC 11539]|uniref:N2227-domain-containing protein n=1 Tax=Gloeophyllum trabeum (strain ATCC 11539 / FP-39264 / Madison 617) TaxID=670483 RepID=S7RQW4_GLOTA|nr:N2227-domain-containing protein [Gloeophyllum trabeum ATCC 11539]EPQ55304.1 N2227-domain-containing protein [Gloeophyllum trabeum ATCC 11539]
MPAPPWPAVASSDLLVLLALVLITLLALKLLPLRDIHGLLSPSPPTDPFSVQHALASYASYRALSLAELDRMRRSYATLLTREQKRLAYELGYTKKLNRYAELIDANARFTSAVCAFARSHYSIPPSPSPSTPDLARVRDALRHLVRDWSAECAAERAKAHAPILAVLSSLPSPSNQTVLVPGSGLNRLAHEIARLGFAVTACEVSAYQNLLYRVLARTQQPEQHTLHPYAHWWSHARSAADLFRAIRVPDVPPFALPSIALLEHDFHAPSARLPPASYDAVVTLFFLDTSLNLLATLARIRELLKRGGTWLNLGPLLWTPGQQAALEGALDEVVAAAEACGFVFDAQERGAKTRAVECEYTADPRAMMRWVYRAEFWAARKV